MAPVIWALRARSDLDTIVCSTGQHRELLDQMLVSFGISADHDLGVMTAGQTLSGIAARVFDAIESVLERVRPDCMLVQGDTTTVMSSALAGAHRQVRIGHIEAGLRTGDRQQPFPEEINRRVVDGISDWLFAPTAAARNNLLREAATPDSVFVTGNTVVDAVRWAIDQAPAPEVTALARRASDTSRALVLITAHRRESFGEPFGRICLAIRTLARRYARQALFVYPVHPNPNVRLPVARYLADLENVALINPLPYVAMIQLIQIARFVLTDSGGIQEEGPSLGVPVLVMRSSTERPEGVAAGCVRLVGTDSDVIVERASALLDDDTGLRRMARVANPYGDGGASRRIVSALLGEPFQEFIEPAFVPETELS